MDTRNTGGGNIWDVFRQMSHSNSPEGILDEIPGAIKPYMNPFIDRGNSAYDVMSPQFNQMSSDPSAFIDALMKNYQPSRGYQLKRDEALRAAGNTAAAGGMRGSLGDIESESRLADSLMGEDMQQWLQNVLGVQSEGLSGLSHIFDTGYDASKSLSDNIANIMGTKAQLKFQEEREKAKRDSDWMSGITGLAGGALGFMAGGPAGAYAGYNIGSSFGGGGNKGGGFPMFSGGASRSTNVPKYYQDAYF